MSKVNRIAVNNAKKLIADGDVNASSPWSISTAEENRILGDPPNWVEYGKWHLGIDMGANRESKSAYKYPYGKGGMVYRSALTAIRQRAGQQGDTSIFDAAGRLLSDIDEDIEMSVEFSLRADVTLSIKSPEIGDDESGFGGVPYTGGVIPNFGAYGDAVIDLSQFHGTGQVFTLMEHDKNRRVGYVSVLREGNEIRAVDGLFFGHSEDATRIKSELKVGAPWQFSVGINAAVDYSRDARRVEVNGRKLMVNTIFSYPRITEISFVTAGADPNTTVFMMSAADQQLHDGCNMKEDTDEILLLREKIDAITALNEKLQAEIDLIRAAEVDRRKAELSALGSIPDAEIEVFSTMAANQYRAVIGAMTRLYGQNSQKQNSHKLSSYMTIPQEGGKEKERDRLDTAAIYQFFNKGVATLSGGNS